MSEAKQILENIIEDFSPEKFTAFFREKTRRYTPLNESFSGYNDDNFKDGLKLGELSFPEDKELLVCAFKMPKNLSERSGKKAQYEKAKKILKDNQKYSSGIFIFHGPGGNFRFSLVYEEPTGTKRNWSSFRRFTYFASSELTNKTFLQRIGEGDFSEPESIREAFSVEKVTKEFYQAIANWYFWAVDSCEFPKDAEEEANGRQMAIIRMITRLIFIWFMREQNLVPRELFKQETIENILKSLSSEESTYYKAVLQNLFFATLSTKREKRKFRTEHRYKGINNDFGNQYVYRYHELFKNPDKLKEYFNSIPFLNGGLFECLDEGKTKNYYVDGFTARKQFQPKVPNFLFFSPEEKVDLNRHYGTKSKTYRVRGLLDILSSFNFTIDENSPYDADVALDPELLGRVFENLLASFNPETSTTARKATGSYYTPREIVDYMVDESLKAYFKTHLENIDDKLEILFDVSKEENPFSEKESEKLVDLIENVRIVDPAVGSGAFPMGALNKLVAILNKIDPGNKKWKEAQLKAADSIPDPSVRREAKEKIEDFFGRKNIDYLRKLYLIQRCIYGVDIQQIAVEIAKLRFFISLLVDERVEEGKDNSGIEPLPNLEFKIMQGNSLVEILTPELLASRTDPEKMKLLDSLKSAKEEFFELSNPNYKSPKREAIEELLEKIIGHERCEAIEEQKGKIQRIEHDTLGEGLFADRVRESNKNKKIAQIKEKIKAIEYSKNFAPDRHFEWHINFSEVFHEKGGFDVVIANPPYVRVDKIEYNQKEFYKKFFLSAQGKYDLYYLFFEKSTQILKDNGTLVFITPNKFCAAKSASVLRSILLSDDSYKELISTSKLSVFEGVANYPVISYMAKSYSHSIFKFREAKSLAFLRESTSAEYELAIDDLSILPENIIPINVSQDSVDLVLRLLAENRKLGDFLSISEGLRIPKKFEAEQGEIGIAKQHQFDKWSNVAEGAYISSSDLKNVISVNSDRFQKIIQDKILIAEDALMITATFDSGRLIPQGGVYFGGARRDTNILSILGIMNSRLLSFVYRILFGGMHMGGGFLRYRTNFLEALPFPKLSLKSHDKVCSLVKDILIIKGSKKVENIVHLESEIDQLVYQLYELTPEEIRVVEGKG